MSNVGKFLFDLCNEFSINILLLKLAADSCGTPAHRGHTHTHTHSGTHTHTPMCRAVPFTFMAMHSVCKWTVLWFRVSDMSKCVLQLFVCLRTQLRDRVAILAAHFDKWPTGSALLHTAKGNSDVELCDGILSTTLSTLDLKHDVIRYVMLTYTHHTAGGRGGGGRGHLMFGLENCLLFLARFHSTRSSCRN